jgi:hypothetical protein
MGHAPLAGVRRSWYNALFSVETAPVEETAMEKVVSWVVYVMNLRGKTNGGRAVCEQSEWDEMERAQPGLHTLIRAGIPTETEAESLARGDAGLPANARLKAR